MKTNEEKNKLISKLEKFQSETPSNWRKEAEHRVNNRDWLRESKKIAIRMLVKMDSLKMKQGDLARAMGVSQQYVSKILKGNQNLTLETMIKIEEILDIHILSVSHT